jgi:DNA-binding MarR family transcriptional regulator
MHSGSRIAKPKVELEIVSMSPEQLEAEALELPIRERAALAHRLLEDLAETGDTKAQYTLKQGQYLSFIYYYTKIHGIPPSEADMQRYFRVSPPTVHQMILTLEARGFIERVPRTPRSVRLMVPRSDLPDLE